MTNTFTDDIRACRINPWENPYQGKDKRVLFVCSAGILRSATGARMYAQKYNTRSCGSYEWALIPISNDLIAWAQEIVFVNKDNFDQVKEGFSLEGKTVIVLDIPDNHEHMAPELQRAFLEQYDSDPRRGDDYTQQGQPIRHPQFASVDSQEG